MNKKKNNFQNIKLLYVRNQSSAINYRHNIHTHNFIEFYFVTENKGEFIINGETIIAEKNDLLIINSGIAHTRVNTNDEFSFITFGIDGISLPEHDTYEKMGDVYNDPLIKSQIDLLFKSYSDQNAIYNDILLNSYTTAILILIIRKFNNKLIFISNSHTIDDCLLVERYIDTNYMNNITLDKLSEIVFMNKFHLVHSFSKYKGISPIQYLINRRVEEAKKLLIDSKLSLEDIAAKAGFSSQSYFNQTFKKLTGMTPTQYRRLKKHHK